LLMPMFHEYCTFHQGSEKQPDLVLPSEKFFIYTLLSWRGEESKI